MADPANITQLLVAWGDGDRAALDQLAPLVQQELRHIAARYMAGERPDHVLQPTALVNEAFLRLMNWKDVHWQNRAHFFGLAARLMRHVLVDLARATLRDKRAGRHLHVTLTEAVEVPSPSRDADFTAVDQALMRLERLNARQAKVVELRFFGGLTLEETAHVIGVSVGTVRRDWDFARAWLYRELDTPA